MPGLAVYLFLSDVFAAFRKEMSQEDQRVFDNVYTV